MLFRLLPVAALAALILPAGADAGQRTYKVVKATHTSSSSQATQDYTGRSTMSWSLAKPTSMAPNRVTISRLPDMVVGLGQVNVTGAYTIDASTRYGRCAWTAPTGDQTHPFAAPADFQLSIGPDPRTGKGVFASFTGGRASLGNAYLGTECSTSLDGEPDVDDTNIVAVKPAALKRKKITLRFGGATNAESTAFQWSTTIVLKRVR